MNTPTPAEVTDKVKQSVREASPGLIKFGRFGYVMKGVLYIFVGILAIYSAVSWGTSNEGLRGSLEHVVGLPFGRILLIIIAIGLVCHAVWRLLQAFMDTENKGCGAGGFAARGGYAGIALIHFGLAFSAASVFLGNGSGSGGEKGWTAWLLNQPFGQWLVVLVGAGFFAAGIYQFYKSYSGEFRKNLILSEMSETEQKWSSRFGTFVFAARGVTFCIMGAFLFLAAYNFNAAETRDLGEVLNVVEQQHFGTLMLGVLAVGFICYGLFMFVLAKYRRMVIT